jgi:hypothetical protein
LKHPPLEEAGDDRGGACFLVAGGGLVEYGLKEKFNYFILFHSRFYSWKKEISFEC